MDRRSRHPTSLVLDPGEDVHCRTSWIVIEVERLGPDRGQGNIIGYLNAKSRIEAQNRAKARWPGRDCEVFVKPDEI